jgi:hypothetical protein
MNIFKIFYEDSFITKREFRTWMAVNLLAVAVLIMCIVVCWPAWSYDRPYQIILKHKSSTLPICEFDGRWLDRDSSYAIIKQVSAATYVLHEEGDVVHFREVVPQLELFDTFPFKCFYVFLFFMTVLSFAEYTVKKEEAQDLADAMIDYVDTNKNN